MYLLPRAACDTVLTQLSFHGVGESTAHCTLLVRGANVASNAFGAVHKLRHRSGGGGISQCDNVHIKHTSVWDII